jgi:hypothetical protein
LETTAKTLATSPPYHRPVLVWNPEARKQLLPRTRKEVDPKIYAVGAAWGSVRQALRYADQHMFSNASSAKPPYRGWMERCEAFAKTSTMPKFDDPDVAAVFALLLGTQVHHALVDTIYPKQRGIAFAFDVALRMVGMELNGRPAVVQARTTPAEPAVQWRDVLLTQSAEVIASCKEVAARLWPSASLAQKTTIAYALFEETAWAREVCVESLEKGVWSPAVLYPIVPDLELAMSLAQKRTQSRSLLELVETFGEAILPALVEVARAPEDSDARFAGEALALFDDPKAAAALAPLVKWAGARPFVQSYFTAHPEYADALEPVAANKNRAAGVAQEVLERARRALETHESEATLDELPAIFRSPPWTAESRPRRPTFDKALALEPIDRAMTIEWKPGERERALALAQRFATLPEATPTTMKKHALLVKRSRAAFFVYKGQRLPDSCTLAAWSSGSDPYGTPALERLSYALAKFGDRGLEGLVRFASALEQVRGDLSLLLRVGAPRLAPVMAKLQSSRSQGKLARRWLHKHAAIAPYGLVPAALGGDEASQHALLQVATLGVDLLAIGAEFGDEAKSALEDVITYDAIWDVPNRIPKLGPRWKPATRPRPVTNDGKVLPIAAMDTIATMLAFTPIDPPYAGLAIVKQTCTARSLAELAWDLARSWEHAGHKSRERWMVMSLVHFADDEVVRRMTPGIRQDLAIDVLEHIDTEIALMELLTVLGRAIQSDDKVTLARIETILDDAAAMRGLDKDELEEELAPVKAVENDGTVSLDFGPRKLRVGFDEHLEPYVKGEDGGRARALPPTRDSDDPERAEKAKALWRDLKEDVAILAARRIAGLKRAMTSGRTWTASRFRRVWIDNGLMKHIARGVVWSDGTTAFRVAEDGSLTTSNDVAFSVASNALVRVLHPLRAAKDEIDRWRTVFADYKILQPFPQLERVPFAPGAALPFVVRDTNEFATRAIERGFTRQWAHGKYQLRRELTIGAMAIEIDGDDVRIVMEGGPDLVEVADAIDDLQAAVPSTRR